MLSLRAARQEVLYRGSDEESHLDNSEENGLFADREGSPSDVDGDARNAPTLVPDDLHQETDFNVCEDEQATIEYDVMDCNMELMLENNVLAQGIRSESQGGK